MYGVEVFRRKLRLKQLEVMKMTGISLRRLHDIEMGIPDRTSVHFYQRLARVYGVTVDELLVEYPDDVVGDGDHPPTVSQYESENNCLIWYRRKNNLTYQEMARHMGITTSEGARINCLREVPQEVYVMRLAAREGITESEFRLKYRKDA